MPHLLLEYSASVPDTPDFDEVLRRLHEAITAKGDFEPANVKSRVLRHESFRVADGASDRAFVHLGVAVLAGRDTERLHETAAALLSVLHDAFPRARLERRCQITLEIREMRRDLYFKAADPSAG
jgi:5-carboxymethyl-2-hydroxymuconate isomerase